MQWRFAARAFLASRFFGGLALTIGCGNLTGYAIGFAPLWQPIPGGPSTHPWTGICLILLGLCSVLPPRRYERLVAAPAVAALTVALLQGVSLLLGRPVAPSLIPWPSIVLAGGDDAIRMGWNTVAMVFFIALAALAGRRRPVILSQSLILISTALPILALVGYAAPTAHFRGDMSVISLVGLLMAAIGVGCRFVRRGYFRAMLSLRRAGRRMRLQLATLVPMIVALGSTIHYLSGGESGGLVAVLILTNCYVLGFIIIHQGMRIAAIAGVDRRLKRSLHDTNVRLKDSLRQTERSNFALAESDAMHRRLANDLRAVIDTAVDGIIIIDENGNVETFNPACARLFGYDPDEVVGKNVKLLMPEGYAAEHDQYLTNYKTTGNARIIGIGRDVVGRRRNGSEFPMALSVGEIQSAGSRRFVGIIHDISDAKSAQEQLEEQAEALRESNIALARSSAEHRRLASDLRAVIDTAVDGIIIIDENGIVETFNPACARLFGYEPEEIKGRNVKTLMPEGYAAQHDQYLTNYRTTGRAKIIGIGRDVVGRRRDGSEFPMALSVGEIQSAGSRRFVGIIHDISEVKSAQDQLEDQARELTRSNAELEQFAYLASHDMQEPLRVIASYCDLLKRRYSDRLDQDGREFIDYAVDGATRMRSLIDDLLIYSRVGRNEITPEPVSLSDVLETSLRGLRRVIEETGATIDAGDLPTVDGNPVMLAQLFQNLVGNAIKFHGAEPPHVHVGGKREGQDWIISVTDNGIGIAPEYKDRVFRMFQRLHGRSEYPGNGLGLALCKRIVERHGGRIWIESRDGPGSTICFTLPVKKPLSVGTAVSEEEEALHARAKAG